MPVATYTKAGAKATTAVKLDKAVFGIEVTNHELLKQAYVGYLSNSRSAGAKTKTRGMVNGSNIKPWKQKGTGRARFGSKYNPIWRGGGIVFGPTGAENYIKKLPTSTKRHAVRQALSLAASDNKVIVIEDLNFKNAKTSEAVALFAKVGAVNNTLVIVDHKADELTRATDNLSNVKLVQAQYLNVYDALNADTIVITSSALIALSAWLGVAAGSAKLATEGTQA